MTEGLAQSTTIEILLIVVAILVALASIFPLLHKFTGGVPVSYRIAFLGRPRSGKTSLLAAMFDEILNSPEQKRIRITGSTTIRKIGEITHSLDTHRKVSPTQAQDRFLFRFFYQPASFLRRFLRYEVEITDFPGEYSDDLFAASEDERLTYDEQFLIDSEYLSWATHSHLLILAIDSAEWLRQGSEYSQTISHKMRSTILALAEQRSEASISDRPYKIALVFTKVDMWDMLSNPENLDFKNEAAFRYNCRSVDELRNNILKEVHLEFSTLTNYLENSNHDFKIFMTSSLKSEDNKERYGIKDLLAFCLPR